MIAFPSGDSQGRRLSGCLAAIIAVALVAASTLSTQAAPGRHASATATHFYITFLPGICGPVNSDCRTSTIAASRARATFHLLLRSLGDAHVRYLPIYYSYSRTNPHAYRPGDTRQAVPQSVDALNRQLRAVRQKDPAAQIDLVGYSLGGVVATSWVISVARPHGLLRSIHSIVTLDSPIKGVHLGAFAPFARRIFGTAVLNSLSPSSPTIKGITAFGSRWWRTAGHLHTVANTADLVVPPSEASLGEIRTVTDSRCPPDFLGIAFCHGAIMEDARVSRYVACHWITSTAQCAAKPTSTPTPTVAPTSSPTSTPTTAPTPVATATPTPSVL